MGKWKFNQDLLQDAIKTGQRFLLDKNLSKKERLEITSDIKRFQRFLDGDFELIKRKRRLNFEGAKKNILRTMKKHHRMFGKDLKNWFIALAQSNIFKCDQEVPIMILSTDEMVIETLANYRENAPIFYKWAKEILFSPKINLVQEAIIDSSSYCFYSDIFHLPFIVIDQLDEAYVLNHEIEHGIEYLMGTPTHQLYSEFGPLYFEALFNDHLYTKHGRQSLSGPLNRIKETQNFLSILSIYLYTMSVFAHHNFEVSDELFKETFLDVTNLDENVLLEFLNDEMVESEITETLGYLLSFLKAIEIRDYNLRKDETGNYMFNDILFSKKFKFNPPLDGFDPYIRFVEEVKQKVK